MMALGLVFILGMTWICVVGIELSARTQLGLLATELAILILFSVVALAKAFSGTHGFVHPEWSWLTPTGFGGISNLSSALLVAVFIYWGWDTAASVNEEAENANTTPGLASVLSTFILVAIFVITTIAAQSVRGADLLTNNPDDVLHATGKIVFGSSGVGTVCFKLLIIAVLTSAAASCQTTILPAARTALSMAIHRAFPPKYGEVDPRYLTPAFATWVFGIVSSVFFATLMIVARYSHGDVLTWAADAVGLMIAYYYGQTGIACVLYYRKHIFKSVKNFIFVGLLPLVGGLTLAFIFIWGLKDFSDPTWEDPPTSWFGRSPVFWIGLGTLLAGIPLMYWWNTKDRAFFRVKPDPIDRRPPPEGGTPLPPLVPEGAPR
jgi:amino acid transporter